MMRSLIALCAAIGLSACVLHLDRNAPGLADVHAPPKPRSANRGPSEQSLVPKPTLQRIPRDPGERLLVILPGAYGGGGGQFNGRSALAMAFVGVELTALYGEREHSHSKPTLFTFLPLVPEYGFGVSAGLTVYQELDRGLGPLYLEAELSYMGLFTASAGYAVQPTDGSHGPQFSLSGLGLFFRTTVLIGRGTQILGGVVIKMPTTFVWSR